MELKNIKIKEAKNFIILKKHYLWGANDMIKSLQKT